MTSTTLVILFAALALMIAEMFLPGGVAFAFGFAMLPVLALFHFGLVTSVGGLVGGWIALATALAVGTQVVLRRCFPPEIANQASDEDLEAYGTMVEVLEEISPDGNAGRIRYQGTSWGATSLDRPLARGDKARLVSRDGMIWIVEPVDDDGDGRPDLFLDDKRTPGGGGKDRGR